MFKKIIHSLVAVSMLTTATSCNDWLEVKPNNEQITADFWKSKEDVESVVLSGYVYLLNSVPTLIKWGELRGGTFYTMTTEYRLQDFNLTTTHSICKYGTMYKIINAANSVLKYAPEVCAKDATYHESIMNAHLCEAYFLRAYTYLVLLKNYKEVPLVLEPYVDDTASFDIAKSPEEVIVAQIKADVEAALATGAAKGRYGDDTWENQGRATKWALYALMADVCLWSEDYDTCKEYCDKILLATDAFRPTLLRETSKWFDIFCPGNSNEGIFEVCWNYQLSNGTNNNFMILWTLDNSSSDLRFTTSAVETIRDEAMELYAANPTAQGRVGRIDHASVYLGEGTGIANYATAQTMYLWKYRGSAEVEVERQNEKDANFIIYRVADIILTKALAETMTGNYPEAFRLLNQIRNRAGLKNFQEIADNDAAAIANLDEITLLEGIIKERQMEFLGEGKRWYDILWFGRIENNKYKEDFISLVIAGNMTTNASWIRSVLANTNAWYMPLPQSDIDHNRLLIQNPYYTK